MSFFPETELGVSGGGRRQPVPPEPGMNTSRKIPGGIFVRFHYGQ